MKTTLLALFLFASSCVFSQYRDRPSLESDWKESIQLSDDAAIYHHGEIFEGPEGFYAVFTDKTGYGRRIVMGEVNRSDGQVTYQGVYSCNCTSETHKVKGMTSKVTATQVNEATRLEYSFTKCTTPGLINSVNRSIAKSFEAHGLAYSYQALETETVRRAKLSKSGDKKIGARILGGIAGFILGLLIVGSIA